MSTKQTVEVRVLGHSLRLRADEDSGRVERVVALVSERAADIQSRTGTVATDRLALMVAIKLAEELLAEREAGKKFRARVHAAASALLTRVEKALN